MQTQSQQSSALSSSLIDGFLRTTSLIYGGLVVLGYIHLHAYYSYFGIPIWSYLTFTDMLLSFLPILLFVLGQLSVFVVTLAIYYWISGKGLYQGWKDYESGTLDPQTGRKKWEYDMGTLRYFMAASFLFLGVAYTVMLLHALSTGCREWLGWNTKGILGTAVFGYLSLIQGLYFLRDKWTDGIPVLIGTFAMLFALALSYLGGLYNAQNVFDHVPVSKTIIRLNEEVIVTDTSTVLLGRTSEAVFLYDRIDSISTIIPSGDVRRVTTRPIELH